MGIWYSFLLELPLMDWSSPESRSDGVMAEYFVAWEGSSGRPGILQCAWCYWGVHLAVHCGEAFQWRLIQQQHVCARGLQFGSGTDDHG